MSTPFFVHNNISASPKHFQLKSSKVSEKVDYVVYNEIASPLLLIMDTMCGRRMKGS